MINMRNYSNSMINCIIPDGVNCSTFDSRFYQMQYLQSA
jgi:hypothetical protein